MIKEISVLDELYNRQVLVKIDDECERCIQQGEDIYVPHFNCLYNGNAIGHGATHCTADACY